MSRLSFQRMIKKIMKNEKQRREQHMLNLRIQKSVLNALQKAIEDFLIETFESQSYYILNCVNAFFMCSIINLLTIHVKRVIIQIKNMQLLNQLRENMTSFDELYEHCKVHIKLII
jgi:hypothetical protein